MFYDIEYFKKKWWVKRVLKAINEIPNASPYDLSKITGISYTTLRLYLSKLEKNGLIKSVDIGEGGALKIVYSLTDLGKQVLGVSLLETPKLRFSMPEEMPTLRSLAAPSVEIAAEETELVFVDEKTGIRFAIPAKITLKLDLKKLKKELEKILP